MALSVADLVHLLATRGQDQYGGEAVSQLEHALQCAQLAEQASETRETIVASLLHDLGHLLSDVADDATRPPQARDDLHQFIALPFLRGVFSDAVLEPIRLHVDAKRYLCATDANYWDALSTASKQSLELQGGIYSEQDAQIFIAQPFAQEAVRLRRYDDLAKLPNTVTPPLSHFQNMIEAIALHR
jgi:phosphonate degradation associated HDIG domain protein